MSDEKKKKESGKIKDRIGRGTGKLKKKLVIKKKTSGNKKDISEAFKKNKKTFSKSAPGKIKSKSSSPIIKKAKPKEEGPISKALRGLQPVPGAGTGEDQNSVENSETPSSINKSTPFDAAVKEANHPRRPYGQRSGSTQNRNGPAQQRTTSQYKGPAGRTGGGGFTPGTTGSGFTPGAAAGAPGTAQNRSGGQNRGPGPGRPHGGNKRKDDNPKTRENKKFFEQLAEKKRQAAVDSVPDQIEIMESVQVGDLARKLNLKPSEVIGKLMKMGEMVTINKTIDSETATLVAAEYNCEVKVISLYEETVIQDEVDTEEDRITRPPVVTIMGHVDHGKTKLLDTIRLSDVIAGESGAITQHIGAYQVATPRGKITFLDTPGHEAFSAMRARGAAVTDIIVLVVAADDGVKPQTREAIAHAKESGVPLIVAVNKVDLPAADVKKVKTQLAAEGVQADDFGGDIVFCEISAKERIGIDNLLEMILLQAEVMNLTANTRIRAMGHVIEARIDPGKGAVATILIEKGILREGDPCVAGAFSSRVRAMFDDYGNRITEAGPSFPVEVIGIDGVPSAGDPFQSVENEKYGREIANKRQHYKQITEAASRAQPNSGDLTTWVQEHKELKVIIKADVQGSVEAIKDGLLKLSTEDVKVRVIHFATGAISESDVNLAMASEAIIIGFHIKASNRAIDLADQNNVQIKYYNIIYDIINDITSAMEGLLEPEKIEETTGKAEIREIFKISRLGNIAGCMVISGKINKNNQIRVIRDGNVIHTGAIKAIKRHKDDVNEVSEGFECGISVEGFNEIMQGDILESYNVKEIARTL